MPNRRDNGRRLNEGVTRGGIYVPPFDIKYAPRRVHSREG